jgi:hypothetical protein
MSKRHGKYVRKISAQKCSFCDWIEAQESEENLDIASASCKVSEQRRLRVAGRGGRAAGAGAGAGAGERHGNAGPRWEAENCDIMKVDETTAVQGQVSKCH